MDKPIVYKSRSYKVAITGKEIENSGGSISFISFERIVQELRRQQQDLRSPDPCNIKGYRVTEQGIEIIWD